MHYQTLKVNTMGIGESQSEATLTLYSHEIYGDALWQKADKPWVLVLPGGSYHYCAKCEGEPVALRFVALGFNAAVLEYSVAEASRFPAPLDDVARALVFLRQKQGANAVALVGFSAGGNLAGMYGNLWNSAALAERLGLEVVSEETRRLLRPSANVLSYALLSRTGLEASLEATAAAAQQIATARAAGMDVPALPIGQILLDQAEELDVVSGFGDEVPPTWLWHSVRDTVVPVVQAYEMAGALAKAGIAHELHTFDEGGHALATACSLVKHPEMPQDMRRAQKWIKLAASWLQEVM